MSSLFSVMTAAALIAMPVSAAMLLSVMLPTAMLFPVVMSTAMLLPVMMPAAVAFSVGVAVLTALDVWIILKCSLRESSGCGIRGTGDSAVEPDTCLRQCVLPLYPN